MLLILIAFTVLTFFLCVAEAWAERDFPRDMFKFFAVFAFSTAVWLLAV